jgi:hypothetical protein
MDGRKGVRSVGWRDCSAENVSTGGSVDGRKGALVWGIIAVRGFIVGDGMVVTGERSILGYIYSRKRFYFLFKNGIASTLFQ